MGESIKGHKNKNSLCYQILELVKEEKSWLESQLKRAHTTGLLTGPHLSDVEAYLTDLGVAFELQSRNTGAIDEVDEEAVSAVANEEEEEEEMMTPELKDEREKQNKNKNKNRNKNKNKNKKNKTGAKGKSAGKR